MNHKNHPTEKTATPIAKPGMEPARDEVAKKAYALYEKERRRPGHEKQNWLEAEAEMSGHGPDEHKGHGDQHAHMAAVAQEGEPTIVKIMKAAASG